MITTEQEQTIIRYLLDKRLTLDVAAEVFDHMILQIRDQMTMKDISFVEAWAITKTDWLSEMLTVYDFRYSGDDITLLMRNLKIKHFKMLLKRAFPLAVLLTIFAFMLLLLPLKGLSIFVIMTMGIALLSVSIISLVKNVKMTHLPKMSDNIQLTMGSEWQSFCVSVPVIIFSIFNVGQSLIWKDEFNMLIDNGFNPKDLGFDIFVLIMIALSCFQISIYKFMRKDYQRDYARALQFLQKVIQVK